MNSKEIIQKLLIKAWHSRGHRDYELSKIQLKEAEAHCSPEDLNELGRIHHIYMQYELDHDRLKQALEHNEKSIQFYESLNEPLKIEHAIRHRADIKLQLGILDEAEIDYLNILDIYEKHPNTIDGNHANALRGYALLLEAKGKFTLAKYQWEIIKTIYQKYNNQNGVQEAEKKLIFLEKNT